MHTDPAQQAFEDWLAQPGQPALLALLRAHQDRVFNLCMQVLRHRQDAEDAAQDCLLKLVDGVRGFQEADQFGRWTTRVAINSALDTLRRNRARAEAAKRKAEEMTHVETATSADVEALYEALEKLDEASRALVVEHDLQKTTLQEMGRRLGVGAAGVLKRLRGAREELRRALCASGMAACVPRLDVFLDGVSPVTAPVGLIGAEIISRVAAVSGLGAGTGTVGTIGAVAMTSTKTVSLVTIAAATLLGLGAGWTGISAVQSHQVAVAEKTNVLADQGAGPSEEELRLRRSLEAARATLLALQQEREAELRRSAKSATGVTPRSEADARAQVARRIAAAHVEDWLWNDDDARYQSLTFDVISLIREEALRTNLTMLEAAKGPDGVVALAMESLRSSNPPPDAATLAQIDEALGRLRGDWAEYLGKRQGMTAIARSRELDRMTGALDSTVYATLDESQYNRWLDARDLWDYSDQVREVSYGGGFAETESQATEILAKHWKQALRLDDAQQVALRPIVDEFQREYLRLETDALSRNTELEHDDVRNLTIEAQRRMSETLGLTPAQAKALEEMTDVYSVTVRRP